MNKNSLVGENMTESLNELNLDTVMLKIIRICLSIGQVEQNI